MLWWAGDALWAGLAVIEITPDVSPSDVLWLAGCPWVLLAVLGAVGDRARAFAPWWIEPQVVRVSVLAATDVLDGNLATAWTATPATPATPGLASSEDERHLLEAVRTEAGRADVVVVFPCRGVERAVCASERQEQLARELAAAGADVVVGSRAHVLQPAGDVDGALVAYGLGNVHSCSTQEPSTRTGVMTVTVSQRGVVDHAWTPASIVGGRPGLLEAPVGRSGRASSAGSARPRPVDDVALSPR